jgi:transcription antitermination protein NusB
VAGKRTTVGSRKRSPAKRVSVTRAAVKRGTAKRAPAQQAAGHRARSLARRLALQALYQMQLNPRSLSDTQKQFAADPEADRVDLDYFRTLLKAIAANREALDLRLARLCEISPPELDPIEHAVLWLGVHELESCPELPYRVALAEAVQLAKQFGATDGHKFVNAVLDRAARELRPHEYGRE